MSQRIRNITLNIADSSGVPYTGDVRVMQRSTDFINTAGWPSGDWDDYLAMTLSHSHALWTPWSDVEAVRGQWNFEVVDSIYANSVERGLTDFHIHLGPYFSEHDYSLPDWAKNLQKSALSNASSYKVLKAAMQDYVHAVVSHFKGRVQLYELWWEANAWYGNGNWPLDQIIDIIKMEALMVRETDPTARICVDLVYITPIGLPFENLYGSSNWTTDYFAQQLVAAGVPFDVLGLETHIGTGGGTVAGDVATLYNWLIELTKLGKPIYVWEDGLESYLPPNFEAQMGQKWWGFLWHGAPSEAKQAEYMVAETLVYLGNPSVIGLHWIFLNDESPWRTNLSGAGVLYANGTRKMSFYALEHLWNGLVVNETVQSVNGVATFRGLAGNYSTSAEGYEVDPSVIHVSEGKHNTFSLLLRPSTSVTSTTDGVVTANSTIAEPTPNMIENPLVILAGVLCIAIVLLAAIILRRRKPSPQR